MRYAEVALNLPLRQSYTYHIPPALDEGLAPGCLARVQFGNTMEAAIVLEIHASAELRTTKPIIEQLDDAPLLLPEHLQLAKRLAESCLAPIGPCCWLMLPPGLTGRSDKRYAFLNDQLPIERPRQLSLFGLGQRVEQPLARQLLDRLRERGPLRLRQLKVAFPKQPVQAELERLCGAGMLASESVLAPPSARMKTVKRLYPTYLPEDIPQLAKQLGKSSQKIRLLEALSARDDGAIGIQDALELAGAKSRAPVKQLLDEGLVCIKKTAAGEQDRIVLAADLEQVDEQLSLWRGDAWARKTMRTIAELPSPPTPKAAREASGASPARINRLVKAGLLEVREERVWRDSLREYDFVPESPPPLTPDQQAAWGAIRPALLEKRSARYLLHGVTGSGKTEIYLRAIEQTLELGRRAILLVPEIALTPQTVRRVSERFPDKVALMHGSLPKGERYDSWQRARAGEVDVVVGTRSALFTPLPDLGLIVLDEEHDSSYKQPPWMSDPHYHAREAAEILAERCQATLILGSATPDLSSWQRAQRGHYRLLRLPKRIVGHRQRILGQASRLGATARYQPLHGDALSADLPPVTVVDMRLELRAGNTSMFSQPLQAALEETLARGEQAMLLLNRRGQATYVFCRDCGYTLECPRCDLPLVYHRADGSLRCHHCGASEQQPACCPECGSSRIRFFGAGTQQVEQALQQRFAAARTLRWDIDTASSPRLHFDILGKFVAREADVLIGTQLIAKGLDLPLVTLVGVVSADIGLSLPDYRAGERVFQLLTQVAGRAGRGLLGGQVILQTYQPGHYVIQAAAKHDYAAFSQRESQYRKQLGYPPYRRLARIVFRDRDPNRAQAAAYYAAEQLRMIIADARLTGTRLIGPAPCFYTRIDRHYRWHLLLRGPDPRAALRKLKPAPGWQMDIDPLDVL
ncbi:MAG: primosomal protein N' [Chloroflexi bacterium]|nr:primosomal protein N' [Chloroflexota bacterium]MCY3582815.1 primosomal protein N' [Chloroflexota bacterium]MYA93807.1 primosomal protein N' [Chloroflexota bacterium]